MTELKYAFRSLFKSPGFTIVAILTIAVGIGANTALFSIYNALVFHSIDLPDASKLVRIWTNNKARNVLAPVSSVPKYRMFSEQQTAFSSIAASSFNAHVLTREGADPEQLTALDVTQSFVPTLGLVLARGRNFTADEDRANGPHVCVISYDVWKTRFGKRENIIGQSIQLDGVGTTVVGVLAQGLPAPIAFVQVLQPWPFSPAFLTEAQLEGGAGYLQITARLKPGVTFAQAVADVHSISTRYAEANPGRLDANNENELRTWIEEQVGPVRPTLVLLLTAVGFVLLIACANVSNLFLGRLSARHKEIGVRLSLGATRRHLVIQFLLESLIFCVMAAAVGIALAFAAIKGVQTAFANQLGNAPFSLDGITLGFTVALSALSSIAIGLIPALQASNVNLSDVLKDTSRGASSGARGKRFRGFLIVVEVSLSVVLLVGSSLLLVSFVKLQGTAPGFSPKGIASVATNAPPGRYKTKDEVVSFYNQILDKLRANPQVKAAAITGGLPPNGAQIRGVYAVFGQPVPPVSERPIAYLTVVSDDYFSLLKIPVRAGRIFEPTDIDTTSLVCVINESFAKRLWPAESAIGKFILIGQKADKRVEIVGVVGDVKLIGLNVPAPDILYQTMRQIQGSTAKTVVALTNGDPSALQATLRGAVASVDRSLAVTGFSTLDAQLSQSVGPQRLTASITGIFAIVALLLSALGLYSVLAYAVTQRTGEIGIRMALGADRRSVIGLVVRQGMQLVAVGLGVGLAAAVAGSHALSSLLFGVQPLDPLVFGAVTLIFAVVAALACLIPSWRASRIDALVALRAD